MGSLDMLVDGINFLKLHFYKYRTRLLSERLAIVPRYSYDYNIIKHKFEKSMKKYQSLRNGFPR
jgi:hypothetical protein